MDDLFRFISIRPPETSDATAVSIQGKSPFQKYAHTHVKDEAPPANKWAGTKKIALEYVDDASSVFATDLDSLRLKDNFLALRKKLSSSDADKDLSWLESTIQEIFGLGSSKLLDDKAFTDDQFAVWDGIVLIFLVPRLQRARFTDLTRVAQVIEVIRRAAARDKSLPEQINDVLGATVFLPPRLLPADPERLRPVAVADLLVVKQHINRYELGEIFNIENVLRGEVRKKTNKHAVTNERTLVIDSTTTTEKATDLATTERFSLKRESENTVKEDISAKAGVQASAKYGPAEFSANASFDYTNSKSDSQKVASDYAKDVTLRATAKVTKSMRVKETTRVLETFQEDEEHTFDNTRKADHVSGIYQWINKIYTAQTFNYGKRLLFDIMIPEPAALLLDAADMNEEKAKLVKPPEFNITPSRLDYSSESKANYYGKFLTLYDVEGVSPPPLDNISVAKTFTLARDDKAVNKSAEVAIPEGYEASRVIIDAMHNYSNVIDNGLLVFVADRKESWDKQDRVHGKVYLDLNPPCAQQVAVAVECWNTLDYAVVIQIECQPTKEAIEKWKLETHSKIVAAHSQKLREYEDAVAAQRLTQPESGPIGSNNPDTNRINERTELKRNAIQLLAKRDLLDFDAIQETPRTSSSSTRHRFPRPDFDKAVKQGAFARFFEQAFEWEQMQYIFYPYYWARKTTWYDRIAQSNDDPLFAQFLKAGQARVVVPVRPTMEPSVWYYLMTGQPWMGGDPPMASDGDYFSIAEEIKEASGAPGEETPYGPSWEVVVPTTLVKLRRGDSIDEVKWQLTRPWSWKPLGEGDEATSTEGEGTTQPGGDGPPPPENDGAMLPEDTEPTLPGGGTASVDESGLLGSSHAGEEVAPV